MIEISKAEQWAIDLYPKEYEHTEKVLSHYTLIEKCNDEYVLFNTIVWGIYILSQEEYDDILNNEDLQRMNIVLDKSIDENSIAIQAFLNRKETPYSIFHQEKYSSYVIFTTNVCNARCFYCYEGNSLPQVGMTLKVAEDVVQYILKTKTNKTINIQWFGGEPLLNTKVIDYITNRLTEENVDFASTIVTNGYLFNDNIYNKISNWKLNRVQITIDGTEEVYNKIKNYKSSDTNPFETVIKHVDELGARGISVRIRVNVGDENIDDIDNLLSYIKARFNGRKNISYYIAPLFGSLNTETGLYPDGFEEKLDALATKYNLKIYSEERIIKKKQTRGCLSESGRGCAINPLGQISPCEHWNDNDIIGDVISGVTNTERYEEWRDKKNVDRICESIKCKMIPICEMYTKCPNNIVCKSEEASKNRTKRLANKLINTYYYAKDKINNMDLTKNGEE